MNITFDGSPSLVAHVTGYESGAEGAVLEIHLQRTDNGAVEINLGSVIGEFPQYSWTFVRLVIRKALEKYIGCPTSEMVGRDVKNSVRAVLHVLKEVPYYTDEIPRLDRLKMGMLLHSIADKNCECGGSGFNINVIAVIPCDCVDKILLLHHYEKWWGLK